MSHCIDCSCSLNVVVAGHSLVGNIPIAVLAERHWHEIQSPVLGGRGRRPCVVVVVCAGLPPPGHNLRVRCEADGGTKARGRAVTVSTTVFAELWATYLCPVTTPLSNVSVFCGLVRKSRCGLIKSLSRYIFNTCGKANRIPLLLLTLHLV